MSATFASSPPPPFPPATAAATPDPDPGFTGWYRFAARGRWQRGPTRPSEDETWEALRAFLRQAGSPPHAEALVIPAGRTPWQRRCP